MRQGELLNRDAFSAKYSKVKVLLLLLLGSLHGLGVPHILFMNQA